MSSTPGNAPLAGRTAIVTGGSRGVGRAVALRLARDGAAVAVNYRRDASAADEVVDLIASEGGRARAYQASIDDQSAVADMVMAIRSDLGPVDLIVSNAGSASRGQDVASTPHADYLQQLHVHALGPIGLIQQLLPDMRKAGSGAVGRGDIVMISSNTTMSAPPNSAPYTMAKAAMETCIRTIAREERRYGIHANIVAPGLIATEMGKRLVSAAKGADIGDLDAESPFGRVCRPEDVAGTVAFLVSPDSGYVTGQHLVVDGGGPNPTIF
ncbi:MULTISPECIES: SDR family NAD(P)-dependent oxidoreductase [Rhodococcus]|uniref:SDR family oxidoreductase n=1 Tax=Rhodococcus oxybenzonivorans TaxID=1990687 RepID=A0AAE4V4W5_9NOCA|nr:MULTISPECIES: SDR family oxidoreductase [Rhodococcus]MDV7242695.1 SDR family oxidoreductase [Rhodococcus oxybenzonivorans]MDV7268678.1 SDR family oxidoreductase [Rhodococcus oxybenzonivorans]MDV7276128.1 SDR family oxidoreductase [Rhodococcus oxybenzonivorans]MDV7332183.1 SDR family oxidoreductase [Rhodococcus oxybenzonivorans]MDV7344388.1 SDR family oxidoreductase [Rhodococcus oxybenzonivorans]